MFCGYRGTLGDKYKKANALTGFISISGYKKIWHSGSIATFKSQVWLYLDKGFGIYVTSNGPPASSTTRALKSILQYISDILLGEMPWLNTTTICTFPKPWKTEEKPEESDDEPASFHELSQQNSPHRSSEYMGKYSNPGFGDVIISSGVHTPLGFKMGQILEADLHYNASEDKFYTNFTGKYWYFKERIPLQFGDYITNKGYDTVYIPLYSPFDQVEAMPFFKGSSKEKYYTLRGDFNGYCTLNAGNRIYRDNTFFIISISCLFYVLDLE